MYCFDVGPIRPPSEAQSLLIRVQRNCPWNRCEFCNVYKGTAFERKTADEVKADIDRAATFYGERTRAVTTAFLQDANALMIAADDLVEIIRHLKSRFPRVDRITTYARGSTAARKSVGELRRLREAGLSRVHVGLESGSSAVLKMMNKGVTPEQFIEGGRKIREAGLSLSEYVMPGLGGREMWREHAVETAAALNRIDPDFIRLRSLSVRPGTPLHERMKRGGFTPLTEEETVREIRLFIENLDGIGSRVVSDHLLNLLQEVEGKLPEEKQDMLDAVDRFLALDPAGKENFMLGARLRYYHGVDDMNEEGRFAFVDSILRRIKRELNEDGYPAGYTIEDFLRKKMESVV
ncbi:MAG: radical SAM protein [bacterium]